MIKLFVSDVDGVLTDGSMYYTENGDEIKRFSTYDGMGFSILKQHGIKTALITSEKTNIVENRAKKMKIDYLFQGVSHNDKLKSALKICEELSINLDISCGIFLFTFSFTFSFTGNIFLYSVIEGI